MKKLKNTQEFSQTIEQGDVLKSQLKSESKEENQNNSTSLRIKEDESKRSVTVPEYYQVENTPFTLVKLKEKWRICIGRNIIHEKEFKTKRAAIRTIDKKGWDLMFSTFVLIASETLTNKKTWEE